MSVEFWLGIGVGILLLYWCFNSIRQLISIGICLNIIAKKVHGSTKYKHHGYWILESNNDEAFTHGLLHPQIYISRALVKRLDKEKLNIILKHEQTHKEQFDPLKTLVTQLIHAILPPLPFKNEIFRIYQVLSELTADQFALGKKESKQTLLKLLYEISNNDNYLLVGFTSSYNRVNLLSGNTNLNAGLVAALIVSMIMICLANIIVSVKAEAPYLCKTSGTLTLENVNETRNLETQVCTDSSSSECVGISSFTTNNYSPLQNQSLYFEFNR